MFSYPTVHTQQPSVPNGVAEHNVTVARAFTKLMGAFVTFWDNDAGSKIHLLANPGQDVAPIGAARQGVSDAAGQPAVPSQPHEGSLRARAQDAAEWCQRPLGDLARFTFKGLDGTMTDLFIHLVAYQLVTLSGTGVSVLD